MFKKYNHICDKHTSRNITPYIDFYIIIIYILYKASLFHSMVCKVYTIFTTLALLLRSIQLINLHLKVQISCLSTQTGQNGFKEIFIPSKVVDSTKEGFCHSNLP